MFLGLTVIFTRSCLYSWFQFHGDIGTRSVGRALPSACMDSPTQQGEVARWCRAGGAGILTLLDPGPRAAQPVAEAGAKEVERIRAALEPRKPPAETKPRPRDARKAWVRAGLRDLRGW